MNIAWIGTGVMGSSMAINLANYGHKVYAYSRTLSKCEPLKNICYTDKINGIIIIANAFILFYAIYFAIIHAGRSIRFPSGGRDSAPGRVAYR